MPCPKGKIRDRTSKRCCAKKSVSRKNDAWERAVRFNEHYYSDRGAGLITKQVQVYIKRANQSYALMVDLLDVASGIAWNRGSKRVAMADIKRARTVDRTLRSHFPSAF